MRVKGDKGRSPLFLREMKRKKEGARCDYLAKSLSKREIEKGITSRKLKLPNSFARQSVEERERRKSINRLADGPQGQ